MKVFVALTVIALIGGSHAFLGGFSTILHNIGEEVKTITHDLVKVAEPVANSVLQTLEKAGTQLLSSEASTLLQHLGQAGAGKRDLGEVMSKIGSFVTHGQEVLKETGNLLQESFKGTVAKINQEINSVLQDAKPLEKLVSEVKSAVEGHNTFVNSLIAKAEQEGMKLVSDVMGHPKRDLLGSFGDAIKQLLTSQANPLKDILDSAITKLEGSVLKLFG